MGLELKAGLVWRVTRSSGLQGFRLPQQNNIQETPHKRRGQGFASAVRASQSPRQQGCWEFKVSLGYMVRPSQKEVQSHGKGVCDRQPVGAYSLRSH